MKKVLAFLVIIAIAAIAHTADQWITVSKVFDGVVLSGTSATNTVINISNERLHGYWALQAHVTGTGTVDRITYEVSLDGVNYMAPASGHQTGLDYEDGLIMTNLTATSGVNGDGKDYTGFTPPLAKYLRIIISGTAVTTNTVWLGRQ